MRFAIRDDDTNFFTTPAELEACYHDIWDEIPVTLSLISKVKGDWKHWIDVVYKQRHNTDWNAWRNDDTPHPIEDNAELVTFLKEKTKEHRLDLSFHAKYHRNEDAVQPKDMNNNYVHGAEFYTNRDLTNYIKQEVGHLSHLFQYPITVFTPPQNLLSMKGYEAVIDAGLNICGGGITFHKKEKTPQGLINIAKQGIFKLLHKEADYPHVLHYSRHNEIAYHYPLQPTTRLESLINDFEMVRRYDGDFVLSTHYIEFDYPMVYDESITMKQVLLSFLDHVAKYQVEKMSLSQLLKN